MGGVKRHIHPAAAGSNLDLTSRLVRGETKDVELRGLEPLTFSLRRLRLHLASCEHRVIDVHVAAAGRLGCSLGAHMGHTVQASLPAGAHVALSR
jgi:hypothetical protein